MNINGTDEDQMFIIYINKNHSYTRVSKYTTFTVLTIVCSFAAQPSSQSMPRGHRIATPEDEWAWYVVGGCAFANFLLPGMLRSFIPDVLDGFVAVGRLGSDGSNGSVSRWIPVTFDLTFFIAGGYVM